jgi:hypothetical protein
VKKQIHPFVDETDLYILLTLGNGNMTEGVRVCVAWAQHFYNIGLRDDLNLDHIGLAVRVNPKQTLDWEDWEALKNAHRNDLNGLLDDFEGLGDWIEG